MLANRLRQIDYNALPISEYSRRYILRMLPVMDYYMDIYRRCLGQMIRRSGRKPQDIVMVDYGGGHGFLSCMAKEQGIGKVVYIDFNSLACNTVKAITGELGIGPDIVLHGDAETLREWCEQTQTKPHMLLGMDVIEHIYSLPDFFAHLFAINPAMDMLFTTGSTPFNPHVMKRLRQVMVSDENGPNGFYEQRRHHIQHSYRHFTKAELDYWAANTRGLNYDDTLLAVESHRPNILADPYNTCDPATGSWTERILPMAEYQALVAPYGAGATVGNGFYNTHRTGAKGLVSRILNLVIKATGLKAIAPFIIINISKA